MKMTFTNRKYPRMKRTVYLLAFLLSASLSFAQQNHDHSKCLTDEHYMEQIHQDPTVLERARQFEEDYKKQVATYGSQTQKAPEKFIIPVVFHVFHIGGPENIPYAQIKNQMDSLNAAYNSPKFGKLRAEFLGVVGSAEIEFRLATKDPQGNCTDGVVRIYDPETENATNNIKFKSAWPTDRYFNIWVVKDINSAQSEFGTTLGYAQFPWFGGAQTDGVVIRSDNVGSIGTGANPVVGVPQWGSTLVHEAGHWLGLYHPFQDSCFGGDGVDDTPPVEAPNFGCNNNVNSCNNETPDMPDMIENYMDYANGSCMAAFTIGQKIRMHTTLKNWRPKLWLPSNLVATGTADPYTQPSCAPIAYFYSLAPSVCQNGTVAFRNNSYNSTSVMTYAWEFPGGTVTDPTVENPTVTYSQAGVYDVTLITSNTLGSDTFTRKHYVTVDPVTAEMGAGFMEGFEYEVFPIDGWKRYSTSATQFTRVSTGAGSIGGSHAVYVSNTPIEVGGRFYLESPAVDLSMVNDPVLSFYAAFSLRAKGTGNTTDLLAIYTSIDCGKTWSIRSNINASNLNTTGSVKPPTTQSSFFPNGPDQWKRHDVLLNAIPQGQRSNVKVRFEFRSDGGHNLFIDNINIGFYSGITEMLNDEANFSVYPNPSAGNTSIRVNMPESKEVKLEVLDVFGKTVSVITDGNSTGGENIFTFNPQGLSSGMYVVRLTVDGQTFTRKLMYIAGN